MNICSQRDRLQCSLESPELTPEGSGYPSWRGNYQTKLVTYLECPLMFLSPFYSSTEALGVGDGQESHGRQPTRAVAVHGVTCCSPWGRKESGTTEQLNWTFICALSGSQVNYICRSFDGHTIFNHNVKKEKKKQHSAPGKNPKYSDHRFSWGIPIYEFLIECILKKE